MSVWDANLSNHAAAVDHCMKLGAVILKPKGRPGTGFQAPPEPERDANA